MKIKPLFPILILLCCVSCTKEIIQYSDKPILFGDGSVETKANSIVTGDNFDEMGVWGYYNGASSFSSEQSLPDFMYNQKVSKSGDAWTYSPLKYWPKGGQLMSFFAYSPYHGDGISDGITLSENNNPGYPYIDYSVQQSPEDQIDLLLSEPRINLSSSESSNGLLAFKMKHALTKISFISDEILIEKIQIHGIYNHGRVSYSTLEDAESCLSWTSLSDTVTYTISTQNGDYSNEFVSTQGKFRYEGKSTQKGTLLLIPQHFSNVKMTVFYRKGEADIELKSQKVTIEGETEWKPGCSMLYNLQYKDSDRLIVLSILVANWNNNETITNDGIGG